MLYIGTSLAIAMVLCLWKERLYKRVPAFVAVQTFQLLEIPFLFAVYNYGSVNFIRNTWFWMDQTNLLLSFISIYSCLDEDSPFAIPGALFLLQTALKTLEYARIDIPSEFTLDAIYYTQKYINLIINISVILIVYTKKYGYMPHWTVNERRAEAISLPYSPTAQAENNSSST